MRALSFFLLTTHAVAKFGAFFGGGFTVKEAEEQGTVGDDVLLEEMEFILRGMQL